MSLLVSVSLVRTSAALTVSAPSFVFTLPPGLQDGDDVWMCVGAGGSGAASVTAASTGWTRLGAETDRNSPSTTDAARFASIWRKTWHTGDPTTVTFTTNSAAMLATGFIVRGGAGVSPTTDVTAGPTSSVNAAIGAFSPVNVGTDLRLWIAWWGNSSTDFVTAVPSPTASDTNPSKRGMQQLAVTNINNPGATSGACYVYFNTVDTGADSGSSTMTLNSSDKWLTRSILLADSAAPSIGDIVVVSQSDPGITADAIQGNETDALNAAKGKFVGGARIL